LHRCGASALLPFDPSNTELLAEIVIAAAASAGQFGAKDLDFALCDTAEILGVVFFMSQLVDEVDELLIAQCARVRERVQQRGKTR
jgi:hypothetical protein